jgi:predicted phosphoribosyltransferase
MRLKATDSQAGLNPRQRRMNVRGAFTVSDQAAVTLKHVLVIDDIFTTGATARAAAQALAQAGAASVWVATLARARRAYQSRSDSIKTKTEDDQGLPSDRKAAIYQDVSIYSSHGKSSF